MENLKKAVQLIAGKIKVEPGTSLEDFWALFPPGTQEAIPKEYHENKTFSLPGVGKITVRIQPSSEGADRGGYVPFLKMRDVLCGGEPVVLEQDSDGEWLFEGRSSVCEPW